jgi:Ca-activated chloride channel family protein
MRFSDPNILYFLIFVPFVYALFVLLGRRKIRELRKLGEVHVLNRFSKKELSGNFKREGLFISAAFLFFVIALARPQAGTRLEPVRIMSSDIYIAVDLSKSMKAEDIKPNRFERARIDALELVNSLHGDRAGLILFAGDAFVQCPLTTDYDALKTFINSLDRDASIASGTSLAAAMEVALNSIKPEEEKYSILILLTDGEVTDEGYEKVLKEVQKRGIKVFSIGIGTEKGAPIPVYDENNKRIGYKKDREGKVVISELHDEMLKTIAERTNAYYFEAGERMDEVGKFLSTISKMKKRELETKKYTVYEERFQVPLVPGIICLFLYLFGTLRTKRETA